MITFEAKPFKVKTWLVLLLPESASSKLPSRGQVMVKGTANGHEFQAALEPDGRGSHWLEIDKKLQQSVGIKAGQSVALAIEPTKDWTEPNVPEDIAKGLADDKEAQSVWQSITPMARREWIRWIRATNNPDTRAKHITVAASKLSKGMRRPCCFNASMCTVPEVSKNGILLDHAT